MGTVLVSAAAGAAAGGGGAWNLGGGGTLGLENWTVDSLKHLFAARRTKKISGIEGRNP